MKKVKLSNIAEGGDLESIQSIYARTSSGLISRILQNNIRKMMSNLLPIIDTEWELGYIDGSGNTVVSNIHLRMKSYVEVIPNKRYICNELTPCQVAVRIYDASGTYISGSYTGRNTVSTELVVFTTPSNAKYIKIYVGKQGIPVLTPRSIYDFGLSMTLV